jgi:hypothetical protein
MARPTTRAACCLVLAAGSCRAVQEPMSRHGRARKPGSTHIPHARSQGWRRPTDRLRRPARAQGPHDGAGQAAAHGAGQPPHLRQPPAASVTGAQQPPLSCQHEASAVAAIYIH